VHADCVSHVVGASSVLNVGQQENKG